MHKFIPTDGANCKVTISKLKPKYYWILAQWIPVNKFVEDGLKNWASVSLITAIMMFNNVFQENNKQDNQ